MNQGDQLDQGGKVEVEHFWWKMWERLRELRVCIRKRMKNVTALTRFVTYGRTCEYRAKCTEFAIISKDCDAKSENMRLEEENEEIS